MDAALIALFARLAEISATQTATAIVDRIAAVKARNKDAETIQVLSETVNLLISDREELIGIARALKEQLVSQQISDADIDHVVNTVLPVLETISSQGGGSKQETAAFMDTVRPILSHDTLKVLQILGFNYRKAIGEPLTEVVHSYVVSLENNPSKTRAKRNSRQR
mgnify:FL=1